MGWAFYLDLELTAPEDAWPALEAATPAAQGISAGWWGFADATLEAVFCADDCDTMTAGSALAAFSHAQGICRIEHGSGEIRVRLCALIDERGEPYLAKPIAALVDAARTGGRGHVALVGDDAHGGVRITIANGKLARERLRDTAALSEQLASLVYGAFVDDAVEDAPKPKRKRKK